MAIFLEHPEVAKNYPPSFSSNIIRHLIDD
jgi:hypothetical protein